MRLPLLLVAITLTAACGGAKDLTSAVTGPGTNTGPTLTTSVTIAGIAFTPSAIQVSPTAVVTWTNSDNINHNVTFSSAAIGATPSFSTGSNTLTMPTVVGTYAYHCTIHASMTGTVLVQ